MSCGRGVSVALVDAPLIAPSFRSAPQRVGTDGPLVAELVALTSDAEGRPFVMDPEQRLVLDDIFAVGPNGKLAAFEVGVIACRQNLKTGILKAAALGKLFISEQRLVVWSAHEFPASREAFRDLQIMLESSPDLEREVLRVTTASGGEAIELTQDRRLIFKARHSGSARSLSGDTVILDEGFALQPEHMGALVPTLAARPDPQLLIGSSAGMAKSGVLRSLRDRGRVGAPRVAYTEWCAPDEECEVPECPHVVGTLGCALDREHLRLAANTAVTRGRITLETVEGMRQSMPPDQFARECLGWWDEPTGDAVIPPNVWAELHDARETTVPPLSFAVDVAPNQSWAAIGVAARNNVGGMHVEVTARGGALDHRPGMDWVIPRCKELREAQSGFRVGIAAGSAGMALKPGLERAGIPVDVVPGSDVATGCALIYASASARTLTHSGQPELANAVASARKDNDAGEGAWKWHRRKSGADITPLYAVTVAAVLHARAKPTEAWGFYA
jgi:hypothetical protein